MGPDPDQTRRHSKRYQKRAEQWATEYQKDARVIELVLSETCRIVRMERGVIVAETRHGFVCANSGIDLSNVDGGSTAVLLPEACVRARPRLGKEAKER